MGRTRVAEAWTKRTLRSTDKRSHEPLVRSSNPKARNLLEVGRPRCLVTAKAKINSTTYQKLGEILAHNPRGVLALSDELSGLLLSLVISWEEGGVGL